MNPVRPHVRGDLDFADDDGVLGKRRERPDIAFLFRRLRDDAGYDRPHVLDPWDRRPPPGVVGWAPLSKTSFSISTTLVTSARSNLMNSLTTSAGGMSTWSMMRTSDRIVLEFSVTIMLEDLGSARKEVNVWGGERYWPSTCWSSIGSA